MKRIWTARKPRAVSWSAASPDSRARCSCPSIPAEPMPSMATSVLVLPPLVSRCPGRFLAQDSLDGARGAGHVTRHQACRQFAVPRSERRDDVGVVGRRSLAPLNGEAEQVHAGGYPEPDLPDGLGQPRAARRGGDSLVKGGVEGEQLLPG